MMNPTPPNLDSEMTPPPLADISQAQRERLSHIDFRLRFLGTIGRNDLVKRFGIKDTAATRDIALYRKLAPQNLIFDPRSKCYRPTEAFTPLFEYPAQAGTDRPGPRVRR